MVNSSRSDSVAEKYFEALNFLLSTGIHPEGEDVAGYTALQHSLTCTPLLHDLRWSQTLLDASAEPIAAINHRNRYGSTCAHEVGRDSIDTTLGGADLLFPHCAAAAGHAILPPTRRDRIAHQGPHMASRARRERRQ